MPLPCPGPNAISLLDIQNEFGGSTPTGLNEYYRNGGLVPSNNTNVPTSGQISFADFFCAVNEIIRYITTTSTNVDASSYFTTDEWTSSTPKRLVVNSEVVVGATNTSNYALLIPSGFGGSFILDNNGSILGAGGAANSGTGGNAIFAGAAVSINNAGLIYAGGGGGGQGGNGGQGSFTTVSSLGQGNVIRQSFSFAPCNQSCTNKYGGSAYCQSDCFQSQLEPFAWITYCGNCAQNVTTISSGGIGGNGGLGRGYNQLPTNGILGNAGGTNAGTGGGGGNGGEWGASGFNGSVGTNGNYTTAPTLGQTGGPSVGGLAGFYVVNNINVTWINTGAVLGRVA